MEISASSFNASLAAMQAGQQRADQASHAIASAPANANSDVASLSEQLIRLDMARQQVEAGSKVVAANDQTLGSLIDTHA